MMWNKAYNISAQLASLPHKYATIIDALVYGKKVDAERPNNLNILYQIGQLYTAKLGGTTNDKEYYIRRVREESKTPGNEAPGTGLVAAQRQATLLDENGYLLPRYLAPTNPRPADLPARVLVPKDERAAFEEAVARAGVAVSAGQTAVDTNGEATVTLPEADARKMEAAFYPPSLRYVYADWNDGSELQYLARFQPFPYGVSPLALGYNYSKRAQVLMTTSGQKPLQVSRGVIDTEPGKACGTGPRRSGSGRPRPRSGSSGRSRRPSAR